MSTDTIAKKKEELAKAYEAEVEAVRKDLEPGEQRIAEAKAAYEKVRDDEEQKAKDGRRAIRDLRVEIAKLRGTAPPPPLSGERNKSGEPRKTPKRVSDEDFKSAVLKMVKAAGDEGTTAAAIAREVGITSGAASGKINSLIESDFPVTHNGKERAARRIIAA